MRIGGVAPRAGLVSIVWASRSRSGTDGLFFFRFHFLPVAVVVVFVVAGVLH